MPNGTDTETVQFKSPTTGEVRPLGTEDWEEALNRGYTPVDHAVMYSPEGKRGLVPNAEMRDYAGRGYQTTPKTEFEKARPGEGITLKGTARAAGEGLKSLASGALSLVDPTRGLSGAALTGMGINPREGTVEERLGEVPAVGAAHEIAAAHRAKEIPAWETPVAGAGALVGMSSEAAREAGARGEGGKVIGQAVAPLAAVAAGELARPVARMARPMLERAGEPFHIGLTGEELFKKGVSPRARAVGWDEAVARPGVQRALQEIAPKTAADLMDGLPEAKERVWKEKIEPVLERQGARPVDMHPAAQAVRDAITPEMREFDEADAQRLESLGDKLEKSRTVEETNRLLTYINGKLETYFQKYPTARRADLLKNLETRGWETARRAIRSQFLDTLEGAGETQTRDARLDYGGLETVENEAQRRVNVADRQKPMSLPRLLGLLGAPVTGGLSIAAGELAHHLNKPDVLIRRGVARMNPPEEAPFTPPAAYEPPPPAAPFQVPRTLTRPVVPPAVEPRFREEATGTVENPTFLGPRGRGGVRLPETKGLLPETVPTARGRLPEVPSVEQIKPRVEAPATAPEVKPPVEIGLKPKAPEERTQGKAVEGIVGQPTTLKTPDGDLPVRYKVVEADAVKTSHDPMTFEENKGYPPGVQERTYHSSKEAQNRVIQQTQNYDPRFTVNTNPDAVNGPPITTKDGVVLGGNSRAMSTYRLYQSGGGDAYKAALVRDAESFGLKPEEIQGMKSPLLVRELDKPVGNLDEARRMATTLNKSFTGALSASERAVSAGRGISQESMDAVAGMLREAGEGTTLRDAMRTDPKRFIDALVKDGAITERERPQFVDAKTGALNEQGKNFIESAFFGSVLRDPNLLESVPKATLNKIEGALADLARLQTREDAWDVTPILRKALEEHVRAKATGLGTADYLRQTNMFGKPEPNPLVAAMVEALDKNPREFRKAFSQFAEDAKVDVPGQVGLGFFKKPEPWKSFNEAFETKLTEEDFARGWMDAVKEANDELKARIQRSSEATAPGAQATPREAGPTEARTAKSAIVQPQAIKLPHPEAVDLKPGESTEQRFYNAEKDEWAPERAANHDAIARALVKGKKPPTDRSPEAIITMGGTASGKTTLARGLIGENANRVNIDADTAKLYVPEYEGLKKSDPLNAAARVHEESSRISKRIIQEVVKHGLDFVYDTSTGGGGEPLFRKLKELGYRVRLIYADVSTDEALRRSKIRAMSSADPTNRGRFVPEHIVRDNHARAARAFGNFSKSPHVDEIEAFDTSSRSPSRIYRRLDGNPEEVYNKKRLEEVQAKAVAHGTEATAAR